MDGTNGKHSLSLSTLQSLELVLDFLDFDFLTLQGIPLLDLELFELELDLLLHHGLTIVFIAISEIGRNWARCLRGKDFLRDSFSLPVGLVLQPLKE